MKKNIKLETLVNIVIIIAGLVLIIFPWLGSAKPINIFYFILGMLAGLRAIEYMFQKDKSDKENINIAIVSFLVPFLSFIKFPNPEMVMPLSLLTWIGLMSIVKLIKLDYLHDRKLPLFKVKLYGFIMFIILGVLTTYSLHFDDKVQIIILGFFVIIIGLMDLFKDHMEYFFEKNKKVKNANSKRL